MIIQNNNAHIIEFVGLPGAGKTTICNAVLSRLEKRDAKDFSSIKNMSELRIEWLKKHRMKRFLSLASEIILNSKILFSECLRASIHFKPIYLKDIHLMLSYPQFNMLINKSKFYNANLFFDQGPLQYLASVVWRLPSPPLSNLRRVLSKTRSRPHIIVYVECDEETSYQRILERPSNDSRFDRMAEGEFFTNIQKYQEAILKIISTYAVLPDNRLIKINSKSGVDINVDIIVKELGAVL